MKLGDRVMVLPTREPTKRKRPVTDPWGTLVMLPAKATLISTEIPYDLETTLTAKREVLTIADFTSAIEVEFDGGGQLFVMPDEVRLLDAIELLAELAWAT